MVPKLPKVGEMVKATYNKHIAGYKYTLKVHKPEAQTLPCINFVFSLRILNNDAYHAVIQGLKTSFKAVGVNTDELNADAYNAGKYPFSFDETNLKYVLVGLKGVSFEELESVAQQVNAAATKSKQGLWKRKITQNDKVDSASTGSKQDLSTRETTPDCNNKPPKQTDTYCYKRNGRKV